MLHVRLALAALAAAALAVGVACPVAPARASFPVPTATTNGETPPPLSATATPSPSGKLVDFSGQLLDDQSGFVFFTTGDAFRIAPGAPVVDATTGGPTKLAPSVRVYARASFDTGSGAIVRLALSARPLPDAASYETVKGFAVALSTEAPNPDLGSGVNNNGRPVLVTFTVEVPPKTPFADPVYVATDASGWSATAIRMDRVDALHYRVSREYSSGTKLLYRYTRGSWRSSERGQNGIQLDPHLLTVANLDTQSIRNVVFSWGDEDQFAPDLGSTIPTPFNVVPFNLPQRH